MLKSIIGAALMTTVASTAPAIASERIRISSEWGDVTAELVDNAATRTLVQMLPLTVSMRDHLRQEKTGRLPAPLPAAERQQGFAIGTLGLWGASDFVIYYRSGRVPSPGIIVLGRVNGDVSIFDRTGPVTVRLERAQ
ncbi:MAG: cyclophilin-like fold protein [Pseudomonadota bacterium]